MPKFLEERLRAEATAKGLTGKKADRYVYGGMNNMGAMQGAKETAQGRAMEKEHEQDQQPEAKQYVSEVHTYDFERPKRPIVSRYSKPKG